MNRIVYQHAEDGSLEALLSRLDVVAAIEAEAEFPDAMSERLYESLSNLTKPQLEALIRGVVRMAKNGILARIQKMGEGE